MSVLEILLLIALAVSLFFNWQLWRYFQAYKNAYHTAIKAIKNEASFNLWFFAGIAIVALIARAANLIKNENE